MTLLVAGHETTASALTWALYWIHHLPEVHDKLGLTAAPPAGLRMIATSQRHE